MLFQVASDRTQVVADLCLHLLGTPEPVHPVDSYRLPPPQAKHSRDGLWAPDPCLSKSCSVEWALAQFIFHGGQRWVFSCHSWSLQLTGLGKALPLTCQHQSSFNYEKRVCSDHTNGASQVSGLGYRGGCATGPHLLSRQSVITALLNT